MIRRQRGWQRARLGGYRSSAAGFLQRPAARLHCHDARLQLCRAIAIRLYLHPRR